MIKNISQIINNNNAPKITKIYYYCEGHKKGNYYLEEDWYENKISICKNCDKFQCNLHINENKDLCMSCINFDSVEMCDKKINKCKFFFVCYYCSKIHCFCYRKLMIVRCVDSGKYSNVICDKHYEECKSDPNVQIRGNGK